MSWRLAKSLEKLRAQVNEAAPRRSTVSDGSIGDAAHATRDSDHNPHCGYPADPTVTAIDITHDPANGADMDELAEALREAKDSRLKYLIWNKRMFSSYPTSSTPTWTWRAYTGVNLHTKHMHVSVQCRGSKDATEDWNIGREWSDVATKEEIEKVVRRVVREELREDRVKLAVGNEQEGYDPDKVNLKAILKEVRK